MKKKYYKLKLPLKLKSSLSANIYKRKNWVIIFCNIYFLFRFSNSLFSWGFPLLMLSVAAAFIYKERDVKITGIQIINQIIHDVNSSDSHCW